MYARSIALALACALLGGCAVPSIHPLYTADTAAFDPRLVGQWKPADKDDDKVQVLTAGPDKTYRLTMGDDPDDKVDLEIHLVKLGDRYFTDTALVHREAEKLNKQYAMLAVPTHLFAKVDFSTPDTIVYQELDRDWLFAAVHKDPPTLAHAGKDGESLILTAPTADLQKFVLKAAADPKAWTAGATYKRVQPPPPSAPNPSK